MGEAHDHIQRAYGEYYASGQTVPANDQADGNVGALENSGAMGGIEVVAVAKTAIILSSAKQLQIAIYQRTSTSYSYTLLGTPVLYTASPTKTWAAGDVIGRFVLPSDAQKYTKAVLATDDAAVSGTIDVFPSLLPR